MQEKKICNIADTITRPFQKDIVSVPLNEGKDLSQSTTGALFCPHYQGKKRLKSVKKREKETRNKN